MWLDGGPVTCKCDAPCSISGATKINEHANSHRRLGSFWKAFHRAKEDTVKLFSETEVSAFTESLIRTLRGSYVIQELGKESLIQFYHRPTSFDEHGNPHPNPHPPLPSPVLCPPPTGDNERLWGSSSLLPSCGKLLHFSPVQGL